MIEYILGYLTLSMVVMTGFILINQKQLQENYLEIEEGRNGTPSNGWYNFYIFTHYLKAPFLCPMIFIIILFNGGKLIK
tara:strand:+ start:8205 stop:8441 length:237 start_codon:yes stop_codon:yes gene_type:complete